MIKRKHIYGLDYLRAISAILIILYHYTTQYDRSIGHIKPWAIQVPWGAYAVNTFFLLSGYLTLCNFNGDAIRFLYKRFVRLWPTFVVCVLITTTCMACMMPERLRSFKDILLNFTMFPSYLGAKAVDGVYWTLSVEVLFYIWFAIFMTPKLRPHLLKIIYVWATCMVIISIFSVLGIEALALKIAHILFITKRGECFVLGMLIALCKKDYLSHIPLLLLCTINSLLNSGNGLTIWTLSLWCVILFLSCTTKKKFIEKPNTLIGKLLVELSRISYPLYLLHQFIGFAILFKLESAGMLKEWILIIPVTISILLALVVHYWVEIPTTRFLLKSKNNVLQKSQGLNI